MKQTTLLHLTFNAIFLALFALSLSSCSPTQTGTGEDLGLMESDLDSQREARYGSGGIPTAEGEGMFRDISFEYDSSNVSDSARMDIEYNARVLNDNPSLKVQLEGHCDERGTAEYNMALGANRAKAVRSVLVSLGIEDARIETISYGEEVPLDPSHNESAWAKNRRVHFSAFGK